MYSKRTLWAIFTSCFNDCTWFLYSDAFKLADCSCSFISASLLVSNEFQTNQQSNLLDATWDSWFNTEKLEFCQYHNESYGYHFYLKVSKKEILIRILLEPSEFLQNIPIIVFKVFYKFLYFTIENIGVLTNKWLEGSAVWTN